jgi:hypothetical protein
MSYNGPPDLGCRIRHSVDQTVANLTVTALAFNTEDYDVGGFHDTAVNNNRITIPSGQGGKYLFTAGVLWQASVAGTLRSMQIRKNGATALVAQTVPLLSSAIFSTAIVVTTEVDMMPGDYVELLVFHDAGANTNVLASPNQSPCMTARKVS